MIDGRFIFMINGRFIFMFIGIGGHGVGIVLSLLRELVRQSHGALVSEERVAGGRHHGVGPQRGLLRDGEIVGDRAVRGGRAVGDHDELGGLVVGVARDGQGVAQHGEAADDAAEERMRLHELRRGRCGDEEAAQVARMRERRGERTGWGRR